MGSIIDFVEEHQENLSWQEEKGLKMKKKVEFPRAHSCRDLKWEREYWKVGNWKLVVGSVSAREEGVISFRQQR